MTRYLFFPPADARLDEIWEYTEERHGEQQAIKYITGLHDHLQKLSDEKIKWEKIPRKWIVPADLDLDVYFSKYEHHFIFFRQFSNNKIGVMSILHEMVDVPMHLKEDLVMLRR